MRRLLLGLVLAVSCAAPGAEPGGEPTPARGLPLARSEFPRAGELTYEVAEVQQGRDTRVDLVVRNGTSRDYDAVLVRVIVLDASGQRASAESPLGSMRRGTSKRHRVYFDPVGFAIDDVLVEVVYTHP